MLATSAFTLMKNKVEVFKDMFTIVSLNIVKIISLTALSWYHVCLGLDTVSGLLRIVVNGVEVVNEEKDYFRGSDVWKPRSLAGKLAGIRIENICTVDSVIQ